MEYLKDMPAKFGGVPLENNACSATGASPKLVSLPSSASSTALCPPRPRPFASDGVTVSADTGVGEGPMIYSSERRLVDSLQVLKPFSVTIVTLSKRRS